MNKVVHEDIDQSDDDEGFELARESSGESVHEGEEFCFENPHFGGENDFKKPKI